jgi:uncharacterized membrane protein YjgN (DUF898 family)
MAIFIGGLFIGDLSGQVFPQAYGFVFGVVFAFCFWLSMHLSKQMHDTFPLAVFLLINVCLYWILRSSDYFKSFSEHHGFDIRMVSSIVSAVCSCLATVAIVKSRSAKEVRCWFREALSGKRVK